MLGIQKIEHLCRPLETRPGRLNRVLDRVEDFVEELLLIDPEKPHKPRGVIDARGTLRHLQNRLYRRVLLPKFWPSPSSHGGIRGRSIKTNILEHVKSSYVFKADIADFYPSIHRKRVYRLFVERLDCSPDVARACTRLCTYNHQLALGLVTSPLLADQVLQVVDERIRGACRKMGLAYTRFVDDITISGAYDLKQSGLPSLIEQILEEHGFRANIDKHLFGELSKSCVTGLRIRKGRLDVSSEYARALDGQLKDAGSLAAGGRFEGPFYTANQLRGRIQFVAWVNPGRRRRLLRKFTSIPWLRHREEAVARGLVASKPKLVSKAAARGPVNQLQSPETLLGLKCPSY